MCPASSSLSPENLLGLMTLASAATPESKQKSQRNAGKILHYNQKTGEHVYFHLGQVDRDDPADWIPKGQEGYVTQKKARRKHEVPPPPPVTPPPPPPPHEDKSPEDKSLSARPDNKSPESKPPARPENKSPSAPTVDLLPRFIIEREDFEHCQAAKIYMDIISNEFEQHEPEQALAFIFNAVQNYSKRYKDGWKPRESYIQLFGS